MEEQEEPQGKGDRKRYRIKKKTRYRLKSTTQKKVKEKVLFALLGVLVLAFLIALITVVASIKL